MSNVLFSFSAAYEVRAFIRESSIPICLDTHCPDFNTALEYSPMAYTIITRINIGLVNREIILYGMDGYENKVEWTIEKSSPEVYMVILSTSEKWLANLLVRYMQYQQAQGCFLWDNVLPNYNSYTTDLDLLTAKGGAYLANKTPSSLESSRIINNFSTYDRVFPNPPPAPSCWIRLPTDFFKNASTLGDVNKIISSALKKQEYGQNSYFSFDSNKGFALVTKIEQINSECLPTPNRWSQDIYVGTKFNLWDYIKRIFFAERGHYRLFVFIVSGNAFYSQRNELIDKNDLTQGLDRLPDDLAKKYYTQSQISGDDSNVSVFVYEFECTREQKEARFISQSVHPAMEHLQKSGIWGALTNTQRP